MHAYSLAGVPRMRLCSSLSVVATFVLSVALLFSTRSFLFGPCLFERLVTNSSFDLSLRKFKFESTSYFHDFLDSFFEMF